MADGLTRAQLEDARSRMQQAHDALTQRVRSTWTHVLYPSAVQPGGNGTGPPIGFALDHTSVVNRAPGRPIPQVVYDKLKGNGAIVDQLGPDTLMAELRKVWDEEKPHVEVATLLDWFASYVYLPRVRDEATLTLAIEKLLGKLDASVAFARGFEAGSGEYDGVAVASTGLGGNVADGLLVWRAALPEKQPGAGDGGGEAEPGRHGDPAPVDPYPHGGGQSQGHLNDSGTLTTVRAPTRFFGSIPLDPDKAGLQVAAIAKEILFELSRSNGAEVSVRLEIEATAPSGYPSDVVEDIRANLRHLKIDESHAGFEEN
jgi:hypothetical protein